MNLKLINTWNDQILAQEVNKAQTFFQRFKGLMFTKSLEPTCALHIEPCQGIHTFFMKYSIDVLYLDRNDIIVAIEENLQPSKIGKMYPRTKSVIELPAGRVEKTQTKVGQTVEFVL